MTARQGGLSWATLAFRQATMAVSFGIDAEQIRKTSDVQAS